MLAIGPRVALSKALRSGLAANTVGRSRLTRAALELGHVNEVRASIGECAEDDFSVGLTPPATSVLFSAKKPRLNPMAEKPTSAQEYGQTPTSRNTGASMTSSKLTDLFRLFNLATLAEKRPVMAP